MFALVIHRTDSAACPAPGGWQTMADEIFSVSFIAEPLYGFHGGKPDRIVLGEALSRPDAKFIDRFAAYDLFEIPQIDLPYGVFAAMQIDRKSARLHISNSVSSSRPYYLYQDRTKIALSSSLRGLKTCGVKLEMNETAWPELMVYRFVSPPSSLVKSVRQLPGGEQFLFDLTDFKLLKKISYSFPNRTTVIGDVNRIAVTTEKILAENIVSSIASSDKPGMLLSGGLDSSLIGQLATKNSLFPDSVSSGFSFANEEDRESEYATTVADHLGIKHRVFEGSEETYLRGLIEAIYHAEMPLHHLQSVMLYLLFKDARERGNDLFLCGEAADGLFGNDAHMRCYKFKSLNSFLNIPPLRSFIRLAHAFKRSDHRLHFLSHQFGANLASDRHFLYNLGQYTEIRLVHELFGFDLSSVVASHRQLMQSFTDQPLLNQISIISLLCEGAITMSVWSKLAEGAGLRIAYPFAAPNMIEHVYAIEWPTKLIEPKYIIRQILRSNGFKEEFIGRPKRSFGFPSTFWALPNKLFQPLVDLASDKFGDQKMKLLQRPEMSCAMLQWNLINIYLFEKLLIDDHDPNELADEVIARHRVISGAKS